MPASLSIPQSKFLALPHKFGAFVGGYGSGKTWVGATKLCKFAWEHPGLQQGYFAPTYPMIRDIFWPTIEECAETMGLDCDIRIGDHEAILSAGGQVRSTIICRSMDRPGSLIGFKIARGMVDEIDTLPLAKARDAWRKLIARLRQKYDGPNGLDVTTTPEGFGFVYDTFVKAPRDHSELAVMYGIVQASTYDNAIHLPDDYIGSMIASYPGELVQAYLHGQFVNLTSGTVYNTFDRALNNTDATENPGETLYVGMDFNVQRMAAVIHVKRDGNPLAVGEIINAYDTPDMIDRIRSAFAGHPIRVYPDASGDNRRSGDASKTDIQMLEQAGFMVCANKSNPRVRDRINSVNAMFANAAGERRYRVNVERCPVYTSCLERQTWDKRGEPDKTHDLDHAPDAGGYFIAHDYPINRPVTAIGLRMAI